MIRLTFPLRRAPFVTQEWANNPDYYKRFSVDGVALKGHNGIDFRCELGIEVVASDSGFAQEVVDQGNKGYGKYIKIIHEWGETVYAHLKSFNIKQGDQVSKGQTIGLSGNTGNSTGPHLHFGVRVNPYNRKDGWGGYTDPAPLLFEGESTESLPKWLINFLGERQIDLGQVEPIIRKWAGDSSSLDSEKTKNFHLSEDRKAIYELVKVSFDKPNADIIKKIILWRDGYLENKGMAEKYRIFVEDIAKRLNVKKQTAKAVLVAIKALVVENSLGNLEWWEKIAEGFIDLYKIIRKGKEGTDEKDN